MEGTLLVGVGRRDSPPATVADQAFLFLRLGRFRRGVNGHGGLDAFYFLFAH